MFNILILGADGIIYNTNYISPDIQQDIQTFGNSGKLFMLSGFNNNSKGRPTYDYGRLMFWNTYPSLKTPDYVIVFSISVTGGGNEKFSVKVGLTGSWNNFTPTSITNPREDIQPSQS